jgi:protein involved in polysaccharide export with SLBB domain
MAFTGIATEVDVRTACAIISLAVHLVASCAMAQGTVASPSLAEAEHQPGIGVSAADKLSIKLQGYPELSGEYRVNADDTVSVPVVGRISIASMTLPQLEHHLARRVSEITGKQNYVTVEIAAYKPVFVTGYVARAGAIQWQPGITVLRAVALSGGIFRPTQQGSVGSTGVEVAKTRIRKGIDQQKRLLAALERLRAERDGKQQLEIAATLVELVGEDEARSLTAAQRVIFTSRHSSLEAQLAALARASALAAQELEALTTQKARVDEQLILRREMRAKVQALVAKAIVRVDRSLEEDLKVADLEEKSVNTAVARARVLATLAGLQREGVLLKQERQSAVESEIYKVELEIAQAAIDVEGAEDEYRRITGENLAQMNGKSFTPKITYSITRIGPNAEEKMSAQEADVLRPGDVLVVVQEAEIGVAPRR